MKKQSSLWIFDAVDTFFFRDGTPFNAGEGGQSGVRGIFPPLMHTLQGAIRTSLALGRGWIPQSQKLWPPELGTPDDLGQLRLKGPYTISRGELICPAPLNLLKGRDRAADKEALTTLRPGPEVLCDLGFVLLPEQAQPLDGAKPLEGCWLTLSGMESVLGGRLPANEEIIGARKVWQHENRVGIERQQHTRTAEDKKLYSCSHVRLNHQEKISLAVQVEGIPEDWQLMSADVLTLGGEGRVAQVQRRAEGVSLPRQPKITPRGGNIYFTATLITPGRYTDPGEVIKKGPPGIPGKCLCACTGKMVQAGGWDVKNNRPRPLAPFIPAGSMWYFEAPEGEMDAVNSLHGALADGWGFGQILIGIWEGM